MNQIEYEGELKFTTELRASELAFVRKVLEDTETYSSEMVYLDLELNDDFSGVCWSQDRTPPPVMVRGINALIRAVRQRLPEFGLTGRLLAHGDVPSDRWLIAIGGDGFAQEMAIDCPSKEMITCPHCHATFTLDITMN